MKSKIHEKYKLHKPIRLPWSCKCDKCTTKANDNINKKIKSYFSICKCWCIQWSHLPTNSPNFTAWQCMDCNECSWFIQDNY